MVAVVDGELNRLLEPVAVDLASRAVAVLVLEELLLIDADGRDGFFGRGDDEAVERQVDLNRQIEVVEREAEHV